MQVNTYSQNMEDVKVLSYFMSKKDPLKKRTLLSIGENNGSDLSNAKLLIEMGWSAVLLEPSCAVFPALSLLHRDNPNVATLNYGIAEKEGFFKFYESGAHVPGGKDISLVSTSVYEETLRWRKQGVQFTETEVHLTTFKKMTEHTGINEFDFVSIDCEAMDKIILQQINLVEIKCSALCIEHNGDADLIDFFIKYCDGFGLKEGHRNAENILFFI